MVGSHRRTTITSCSAMRAVVLCRCLRASLTFGVVANTLRKGNAQRSFVQGSVTTRAMVIQRNPLLLTERSLLESKLSRQCPRLLILGPQRRSRVSSITIRSEEHTSELQSRQYLVCR